MTDDQDIHDGVQVRWKVKCKESELEYKAEAGYFEVEPVCPMSILDTPVVFLWMQFNNSVKLRLNAVSPRVFKGGNPIGKCF